MIYALLIAAGIWALGALIGAPRMLRWVLILALYGAILSAHLILPDGAPLREATGGSATPWLVLGGMGLVIAGYAWVLRSLKARARPAAGAATGKNFTATELERYARHIILREVGGPGQTRLKHARVLVVGAGGLGSPALLYLAAAGVGRIGVIDDDVVENSNLQRQVIHRDADIGTPKVFSAERAMRAQNPAVQVRSYHRRLTEEVAESLFADYDLILDGTDNFETRYLVNRIAVAQGKPLIAAALTQWEGQISLYDPGRGAPCYRCVFPEAPAPGLAPSCAEAGVIGPLPGVMGAMMAVEAIKELTGAGEGLRGHLLIYDALHAETRKITVKMRPDCPICGAGAGG